MTHIFEPGVLRDLLRRDPRGAIGFLFATAHPQALPHVEIVQASMEGIAGPVWDTQRERFLIRFEIAVPPVHVDGLPETSQQKELPAACPGSVNDGGAANPPAARTASAADPAGT